MRYPSMGKNPRNAVSVPALSGGVNLADALNLVDDNQMTDCKNVWYKDGFLQTKPGQKLDEVKGDESDRFYFFDGNKGEAALIPYFSTNEVYVDDVKYKVLWILKGNSARIYLVSPSQVFPTKNLSITKESFSPEMQLDNFNIQSLAFYNDKPTLTYGKGLYAFATFEGDYVFLFELVEDNGIEKFKFIEPGYLYSPEVYLNGKSEEYLNLPSDIKAEYAAPSLYEGHNAISNAWSCYGFTTDAKGSSFVLPDSYLDMFIQFEYTDPRSGGVRKSGSFTIGKNTFGNPVILNSEGKEIGYGKIFEDVTGTVTSGALSSVEDGDIYFSVDATIDKRIHFWIPKKDVDKLDPSVSSDYYNFCFRDALGVTTNNLIVKMRPIPQTFADKTARKSNFARMTITDTFGSGSEGISGGNRIFLAGSSGSKKNLLAWSDIDEPTFFSENNYTYVGDASQKITALKKQDNMLVIYKINEMFYTFKSQGTSYTSEDLKLGNVADVTTLDSTFPIIQISSDIGCDKPHSVQLCGNRLVWAHRNKIYMLRSANQYSNVNVSVISNMLGNITLSPNSSGATHDGYYFLHSTNSIYVLNYDQYYFNSLPSYSDTKKSNRKLQWHIWETPEKGDGKTIMISDYDNFGFCSALTLDNGQSEDKYLSVIKPVLWLFDENYAKDDTISIKIDENDQKTITTTAEPIKSMVQTKMFDLGAMDRFKSIEQMYIEFGKCESDVNVQYLTERGNLDAFWVDLADTAEEHSPEFIKTKRLLPGIKRALRFGMRLTTKGQIKLGGILIKFKYMGVTR